MEVHRGHGYVEHGAYKTLGQAAQYAHMLSAGDDVRAARVIDTKTGRIVAAY